MKKIFITSLSLFATLIMFSTIHTSCTKNCTPTTTTTTKKTIQVLWVGTYLSNGSSVSQFISLSIKPDGTFICDSKGAGKQYLSIGTWSLTGDTLSCTATCVYGLPSNIGVTENHKSIFNNVDTGNV